MEHIGAIIAENPQGRFEQVVDDERFQIWQDVETERLFCRDRQSDGASAWNEVAYVAAMQKQAWDDWAFQSARDEDEFTDIIAFCPVSAEVDRDGITWIVWFDICDE